MGWEMKVVDFRRESEWLNECLVIYHVEGGHDARSGHFPTGPALTSTPARTRGQVISEKLDIRR